MNRIQGQWAAGGILWVAMASIGSLTAAGARAAGADTAGADSAAGAAATAAGQSAQPATDRKPTVEELERRIEILEQKLEAQQRSAASAQPVTEQQAAAATVSNPQSFAGPGGCSF